MNTEIDDAHMKMRSALGELAAAIHEGTDDDRKAALQRAIDAFTILCRAVESPF